jgi:glycosyltransferase involved in cell wall biosynthesis
MNSFGCPARSPDGLAQGAVASAPARDAATPARGRVLLVTSNFPRWAGDSTTPFVLHLAQDLIALGWEVEVLAPHAPGAARRERLDGVPVTRFRYLWPERLETVCYQGGALVNLRKHPANRLKLPALVLAEALALAFMLVRGRVDLVSAHWILPQGFVAAMVAACFGVPVAVTVHGGDVFGLRGRVAAWFKRRALGLAAAVTANSTATLAAARALAPAHPALHRIPIGATVPPPPAEEAVEALRRRYRRAGGPLLVFVGRLVEEKGAGDLIQAVARLARDMPGVSAMILGEGPDRPVLKGLAMGLGVAERVHFRGWADPGDVPAYLAAADIFVGPSKRAPDGWVEAQGLTFVEAMLAGTPVVATRSGGIPDAVRHEETGLLVSEDAPAEIAAAVARIAKDPALGARLARDGRALALDAFTRERSAGAFDALFTELIDARG